MKRLTLAAAALTSSALILSGVSAAPAPAAEASSQALAAGVWLADELQGGLLYSPYGDDESNVGLDFAQTVDTMRVLHTLGGFRAEENQVLDALEARDVEKLLIPRGNAVRLLLALVDVGADPTDFGGVNIKARVEDQVAAGQLGGGGTVIAAMTAEVLTELDSPLAGPVTDGLLDQQCAPGFFRGYPSSSASCTTGEAGSPPDLDATATAVLSLANQADDPAVDEALDQAVAWLKSQQATDGSFSGFYPRNYANAVSTGLAARALASRGEDDAASQAAAWLYEVQSSTRLVCDSPFSRDKGAVALTPAAFQTGIDRGLAGAAARSESRAATIASALALRSYVAPAALPEKNLFLYQRTGRNPAEAGSSVTYDVEGLAPLERFCVGGLSAKPGRADATGAASFIGKLPTTQVRTDVTVTGSSAQRIGYASIGSVTAKKLTVKAKYAKRPRGSQQLVTVSGLEFGERVIVYTLGRSFTSKANSKGEWSVRFTVGSSTGKKTVRAYGAFAGRVGETSFTIVK